MAIGNQKPKKEHIDVGDTTYRNRLMRYLSENQIRLAKTIELVEVMDGKTNEEKETIAKELLEKILAGEISFSDTDHYEIDPEMYQMFIVPIMKLLRSLPDGTKVSTEQLIKESGLKVKSDQQGFLHQIHCLLIYADKNEEQLLEKPVDDIEYRGSPLTQTYTVRHRK